LTIKILAKDNPAVAAAAVQAQATPEEIAKLNALVQFQKIHMNLSAMPQNDAYAKFKKYKPETQAVLSELYHPKYTQDDRGFFYNAARGVLNMAKSAAYYGGGSTKDIFSQVMNFNPTSAITKVTVNTAKTAGQYLLTPLASEGNPVGRTLHTLIRPITKLVKQPYEAQVLYENATDNNFGKDWRTMADMFGQGITELLPGGKDVTANYKGGGWMQYWAQASEPEAIFDSNATAKFESEIDPNVATVAKMLASGKDLVAEFDTYKSNPEITSLIAKWVGGDDATSMAISDAVARYSKSKISPGRDVARDLISVLPHEWEKAVLGDSQWRQVFNSVSGPIDFGVTFGADPLLIAGKANKAALALRYGLAKNGETAADLARVVETRPQVAKYFDKAGQLVDKFKVGTPEESALAYTELRNRYKELSPGLINDMAQFGVKDAKSTIQFFQGQNDITALTQGTAVMQRTVLYPRYTVVDSLSNKVKDVANFMLNTKKFRNTGIPGATEDLSKIMSQDPVHWAEKLGVDEQFALSPEGQKLRFFTERDRTISARVNRLVKAFEIAPKQERIIQISDASDADKAFALARSIGMDKTSSSMIRRYWVGADEGQRLVVLTGLLKSIGRAIGLEYSAVGQRLYASIDDLSKELYSVSQGSVDLGELNVKLGTISPAGIEAPGGIRQTVQESMRAVTGEGKASQVNASIVSEMKQNEAERKVLGLAKKQLKLQAKTGIDVTDKLAMVEQQMGLLGARWVKLNNARKGIKGAILEGDLPSDVNKFNAAEVGGVQRAIRVYQLENARALPNFAEWRAASARAGVMNKVVGGTANNAAAMAVTDFWSFLNLFPRLGIRTSVEEVGTHLFINGAEGLGLYIKGREVSRALRVNAVPGVKNAILKEQGFLKEVEQTNLGVLYNSLYKTLGKTKTKEELIALAEDPEKLGQAVAESVLNNRFRPSFFNTAMGNRVAEYAADFARFDGKPVIEDILGSSYRAEMRLSDTEVASRSLEQFGPSIALNPNITEALKFHKFRGEYTELPSSGKGSEGFLVNWLLELNNTVGKRNGTFGNIVLWNAHRPQDEVVSKLVDYINTPEGQVLAKRFAIYDEVGAQNFALRIYADATYALRDSAGRINNKLVNAIRDAGGMDKFTLDDLAKIDKISNYVRPTSILGRELVPVESSDAPNIIRRTMDNGYGWIGKQIALLDREPITYGNYIMYREQFRKWQQNVERGLLDSGATPDLAKNAAALKAHDMSLNLARNRTLAFVDNADIRTNLAFSLKTFGRYYRATEDFYRRAVRIAKYEPEALVRLAIANQTFEDSGFIHKDDKGQMYFTYPGQDILNDMLNSTLYKFLGIEVKQPMPVVYGGYVKMLTPSLDPQSSAPRIGGPVSSLAISAFEHLPFVGDFIKSHETAITGGFNPDLPLWRKVLPAQVLRAVDIGFGGDANVDARFNAIIKSMRLLVTTGNGPQKPADVDKFLHDTTIQAVNMQVTKLILGEMAPASIQGFENTTVPSELIRSGVFTWSTEFTKFMNRYPNDPQAFSKALVDFATIYPSKLAFTVSATTAGTEAGFQKTYEAAKFIKTNPNLFLKHKEGASFFLPINGTSDYQSYQYLKSNGYVNNKILRDFVYEIATANARKTYYKISDDINAKIASSNDPTYKRYLRDQLQTQQQGLKAAFPMLATALSGGNQQLKVNALNDLRDVLKSGLSPQPKLTLTFNKMIDTYDKYAEQISKMGNTTNDRNYKKFLKDDIKNELVTIAGSNANAQAVYNTLLEPLIGE
jgi:hypothetical protein